jgi:hypothetical protein
VSLPILVVLVTHGFGATAFDGVAKNESSELTKARTTAKCVTRLALVILIFTMPSSQLKG